jgi:hypothetical protein
MVLVIKDRVRESTTTTGTGTITLNGAIAGFRAFSSVMANGDTTWYAIVIPAGAWETGVGTWVAGNQLQRTTVLDSSNAGALVNFGSGTKDVFMAMPAPKANVMNNTYPAGTIIAYQQSAAPIYWTKQVTHNDKALRVVSGTASSGGANAFSSVLTNAFSSANTTITQSTMASHSHGITTVSNPTIMTTAGTGESFAAGSSGTHQGLGAVISINSAGGDGAHAHVVQLNVQYVDLILASKD